MEPERTPNLAVPQNSVGQILVLHISLQKPYPSAKSQGTSNGRGNLPIVTGSTATLSIISSLQDDLQSLAPEVYPFMRQKHVGPRVAASVSLMVCGLH